MLAHEEPAVEFWRAAGYQLTSHVRPFAEDLSVFPAMRLIRRLSPQMTLPSWRPSKRACT